jgi:hypothetical protein
MGYEVEEAVQNLLTVMSRGDANIIVAIEKLIDAKIKAALAADRATSSADERIDLR